MKLKFFFLILSIQSLAFGAPHHIPSDPAEAGPQIPTVGSSFFDKIFSSQAGLETRHIVPFPLQNLMERIVSFDSTLSHSLFPFSRSLQRPVDLSYDPLLNPRLVLAASSGIAQNKLFLGYVKAMDQLEVISFNDEAGRFEFQIVKDYSKDPKVYYADRGLCLSCHQGQSPIFSIGPWRDTSLGIMDEMIATKLGLSPQESGNSQLLLSKLFEARSSESNAATLDSLVRLSNQVTVDQRLWLHGCGSNRACRLGLLLNTLALNFSRAGEFKRVAEQTLSSSEIENQKVYNSLLSSTDLGVREIVARNAVNGKQDAGAVAHMKEAILEIIANIYRLSPTDNPASPREQKLGPINLRFSRLADFVLSDLNNLYSEGRRAENIGQALVVLFNKGSAIFDAGPLNKPLIMNTLLAELGSAKAGEYSAWLNRPSPEKKAFNDFIIPTFKTTELNVLSRHCAACHSGTDRFPPQFLHGTESDVLVKIKAMKPLIAYKIENQLMPPTPARQSLFRDSGDREVILRYLDSLP